MHGKVEVGAGCEPVPGPAELEKTKIALKFVLMGVVGETPG